jgi:hypothetical protein
MYGHILQVTNAKRVERVEHKRQERNCQASTKYKDVDRTTEKSPGAAIEDRRLRASEAPDGRALPGIRQETSRLSATATHWPVFYISAIAPGYYLLWHLVRAKTS